MASADEVDQVVMMEDGQNGYDAFAALVTSSLNRGANVSIRSGYAPQDLGIYLMSTPAALYRNAIDLNRYSNSVARRVINAYNDIIIDAANQLRTIDELTAPVKAARLRSILAQLKESLGTWAGDATEITALELQGLRSCNPSLSRSSYARCYLLAPGMQCAPWRSARNLRSRWSPLTQRSSMWWRYRMTYLQQCKAHRHTFSLTAAQGATITLPNGEVLTKAFRGIATDQAERFSQVVRNGLLTGETTPAIAKRLVGQLAIW